MSKRWKSSVFPLKDELATDLILQSLSGKIKPFIVNFNMIENNKTLPKLLGMLRTTESNIKGWIQIHSIGSAKRKEKEKVKSKGNGKTKTQREKCIET